jgi:hypothetical protein
MEIEDTADINSKTFMEKVDAFRVRCTSYLPLWEECFSEFDPPYIDTQ